MDVAVFSTKPYDRSFLDAANAGRICPHNIIAAGATVGLTGEEGAVLRRTLIPALGYGLLGGVLAFFFVAG